jgi:hypothetical protein
LHVFGYSKICDFIGTLVNEYIFRLNIAMDDVGVM